MLKSRSREGAWIEIDIAAANNPGGDSRSREGAWIEIASMLARAICTARRSREGAWIEIMDKGIAKINADVAPVRERGLKLRTRTTVLPTLWVAPARERGLKSFAHPQITAHEPSLPQGSVD